MGWNWDDGLVKTLVKAGPAFCKKTNTDLVAETVGRFDVACGLDTTVDEMRAVVETLH